MEAVPVRTGDLVLWDSAVPHHNVAAAASNTRPRMCAYIDIAPADPGFYLPPDEQIAAQRGRLQSSCMGRPEAPVNEDEQRCVIPEWEALPLDYRLKFTTTGQYRHLRTTPLTTGSKASCACSRTAGCPWRPWTSLARRQPMSHASTTALNAPSFWR